MNEAGAAAAEALRRDLAAGDFAEVLDRVDEALDDAGDSVCAQLYAANVNAILRPRARLV